VFQSSALYLLHFLTMLGARSSDAFALIKALMPRANATLLLEKRVPSLHLRDAWVT